MKKYWKIQDENGDYVDATGKRYAVYGALDVTLPDGMEYYECNGLVDAMGMLGVSIAPATITEPFIAANYRYSRLRVYDALTKAGIALTSEQKERMSMANDLGFDDEMFAAMYDDLKASGINVDAVLKGCVL